MNSCKVLNQNIFKMTTVHSIILKPKIFYDTIENIESLLDSTSNDWNIKEFNKIKIPSDCFPYTNYHVMITAHTNGYSYNQKWKFCNSTYIPSYEYFTLDPSKRFCVCRFEIVNKEFINLLYSLHRGIFSMQDYYDWRENFVHDNAYLHGDYDKFRGRKSYIDFDLGNRINAVKREYNDRNMILNSSAAVGYLDYNSSYIDYCTSIVIMKYFKYDISFEDLQEINHSNEITEKIKMKYIENELLIKPYLDGIDLAKSMLEYTQE